MAHTPGPWKWSDQYETGDDRPTFSLIGEGGYGILSCDGVENSPQCLHDEANARLIAASPDLLDALTKLVNGASSGNSPTSAALLKNARAAIAKATGATP